MTKHRQLAGLLVRKVSLVVQPLPHPGNRGKHPEQATYSALQLNLKTNLRTQN